MSLEQRRHRCQARRQLNLLGRLIAPAGCAETVNQLVDLLDRLARDILDRRQRRAHRAGIPVLQQARATGLHEDHVDRVCRGVVQVPRDPIALLGDREPTLARGLALGPLGALTQLSLPLAALAHLITDDPGATPDDDRAQDRDRGKPRGGRRGDTNVDRAQRHHGGRNLAEPIGSPPVDSQIEQGDSRSEWGAESVAEAFDRRARDGAHYKDSQRPAAVRQERQGGGRSQRDAQRIEGSGRPGSVRHHRECEAECDRRDRGVARHWQPGAPGAPRRGGGSAGDAHVRTSVTREKCSSSPPREGSWVPLGRDGRFLLWGVLVDAARA